MDNLKNNEKIIFIPGWVDSGGLHGYKYSLDIWNKKIDLNKKLNVEFVIAHSAGSLAALYNWNIYQNFKIILINPVLIKNNIFNRWAKSMIFEGVGFSLERSKLLPYTFIALYRVVKLFKVPVIEILNKIPKEDIFIIYGEKDKYLSNFELIDDFKKREFKIKIVKDFGHPYDEKIEKVIEENLIDLK